MCIMTDINLHSCPARICPQGLARHMNIQNTCNLSTQNTNRFNKKHSKLQQLHWSVKNESVLLAHCGSVAGSKSLCSCLCQFATKQQTDLVGIQEWSQQLWSLCIKLQYLACPSDVMALCCWTSEVCICIQELLHQTKRVSIIAP